MPKPMIKRKRGGQPGNRNAVGHGAPWGNTNAYKHGVYERLKLPPTVNNLGIPEKYFVAWFWSCIGTLGYRWDELQQYDGEVRLHTKNYPDGTYAPDYVTIRRDNRTVFDSRKCAERHIPRSKSERSDGCNQK